MKAASHLLSIHKVYEAVELLKVNNFYRLLHVCVLDFFLLFCFCCLFFFFPTKYLR